jgi:hypothetical protein
MDHLLMQTAAPYDAQSIIDAEIEIAMLPPPPWQECTHALLGIAFALGCLEMFVLSRHRTMDAAVLLQLVLW